MKLLALSVNALLVAYLVGSIPFGYLIALGARGVDIRKVGSGNIGATNVGRVLGFRFFVLVFVLDLLKGFLPTYGAARLVESVTGQGFPTLPVLSALAAILGHNFPAYLRFRGGKGVATSLGALLALDAPAALAAAGGFGCALLATRYVSVSSLFGGVVFAVVHFVRSRAPLSRDELPMTLVTIALLVLLFFRHRKNLARLWEGTEPRVPLRRRKKPPEGKVAWVLVLLFAAALAGVAGALAVHAAKRAELRLGPCTLTEVARVATGHQRAERLAFADRGRLLAVTCPRYDRVVLYRVTDDLRLELYRDIELEGHPVAIWPAEDRLYVLQRPAGDARHVEPGFWETFDFQGRRIGSRYRVGFYPDDLAITPDGRHALVLTSGRAEGDPHRPRPALAVIELGADSSAHRVAGRVEIDHDGWDPDRLALSASGRRALVGMLRKDQAVTIDLADPAQPVIVDRSNPGMNPETVRLDLPELGECVAWPRPLESAFDIYEAASMRPLGRFCLRGGLNLSPTRPTGVAEAAERGLVAVATRSGSVHLIAIRPRPDQRAVAAADSAPGLRRR